MVRCIANRCLRLIRCVVGHELGNESGPIHRGQVGNPRSQTTKIQPTTKVEKSWECMLKLKVQLSIIKLLPCI